MFIYLLSGLRNGFVRDAREISQVSASSRSLFMRVRTVIGINDYIGHQLDSRPRNHIMAPDNCSVGSGFKASVSLQTVADSPLRRKGGRGFRISSFRVSGLFTSRIAELCSKARLRWRSRHAAHTTNIK